MNEIVNASRWLDGSVSPDEIEHGQQSDSTGPSAWCAVVDSFTNLSRSTIGNMPDTLAQFIGAYREEVLRRCRSKVAKRPDPPATHAEIERGIPRFLDDIVSELGDGPSRKLQMTQSAKQHGADLFLDGFTLGQVVHDYGAVCQAVTDLAVELKAPISPEDFRTLNRCLDDSIADAVSAHGRQGQIADSPNQSMTLRNMIVTALHGFEVLQSGTVGIDGSTGQLVHRCLLLMKELTTTLH